MQSAKNSAATGGGIFSSSELMAACVRHNAPGAAEQPDKMASAASATRRMPRAVWLRCGYERASSTYISWSIKYSKYNDLYWTVKSIKSDAQNQERCGAQA